MVRSDRNPWVAFAALCACFFMIMLDSTIVTVTIPSMLTGLRANLNEIIWVNSVYLLANTVPLLLTGRLGDRFGPRRVLLAGLLIFTGASLWCGLAGSPGTLIAARAVQGLGAAAMTPQTLAFISRLFPADRRRGPITIWGAVAGVAIITGPVLGGLLVQRLSWRWIFLINVPIGLAGLAIALAFLPNRLPRQRPRFDVAGALLASAGLFALVFGVQNGQHYHWGPVLGPIAVWHVIGFGLLLLALFVWLQRRRQRAATEPLLPLRLFAGVFGNANLTHAALGFATTGMFLPLVIYLQTVLGLTALQSSLLTAPMAVAAGLAAALAGRRWDRLGAMHFVMFGLGTLAAATIALAWQAEPTTAPLALVPGLVVAGIGIGCVYSPLTNAAMSAVPGELVGAASGVFNTSRQVGGVLGSAASGLLLQVGIAVAVPDAAREHAERLPLQFRDQFVDEITKAANTASQFSGTGPAAPPDLPPNVVEFLRTVATDAFHLGFTNAAKATLVLPVVVLILGMIAAAGLREPTPTHVQPELHPASG
ncbi:MAG TPA: DHA2 family efflux MFS transporter permease subunit [Actinophytocola sp.]|uniref:DHA2 family efflux MFS transporter permease subunit n=1 Tax=Actinophytocola sp. TaxID=1872138 RepID=UPI002DDCB6A0|nr:DHA2 family efflux MFS transporter permease subunit [Actinophytocola sp.]HEV2784654.1 DHA2 family efflux MFS transporter permease subunit [Actinophytocola sp.]